MGGTAAYVSPKLQDECLLDLASAVVRVSRESRVPIEKLRAEYLARDAKQAWPGRTQDRWFHWFREACESLALRATIEPLALEDALQLVQDGAVMVGGTDRLVVLLGWDGKRAEIAAGEIDQRRKVTRPELLALLGRSADDEGGMSWVAVEQPDVSDASQARLLHDRPVRRLIQILRPEWSDIWLIIVFAFFAGVLSLATPIAVESLVNTVAFGQVLQPLVVLATLLFAFLSFAAVMQALQTFAAEIIQRRLFARVAADLAHRIPRVDQGKLGAAHGPELVNRFLDVVTLQKAAASLLLDGVSIVLATLVGMTVLAFYHPFLLGFDILLLLLVVSGIWLLGLGGVDTGIYESKQKYRLTSWLEDLMRCNRGFKAGGGAEFAIDRANLITANYLNARSKHFKILFRQILFVLGLQAVAGTVLLGGGGWLVIQESLTLGELVAAELIVSIILASLAKLGKHLESFYDAVAAVDKLGVLFDLEVERNDGLLTMPEGPGAEVHLNGVRCTTGGDKLRSGLTAHFKPGARVALLGGRRAGKSAVLTMLYGAQEPTGGSVQVEGIDPADLRPDVLRSYVAMVGDNEVFEGTIAENIHLGRPKVSPSVVRNALAAVGLLGDVQQMPEHVDTKLSPSGAPLSETQRRLLTLARAIAVEPKMLLIDASLDALPDADLSHVIATLNDTDRNWTVIVGTGRYDIASRLGETIILDSQSHPDH